MHSEAIIGLIQNTALLLGLAVLYDNIRHSPQYQSNRTKIITGVILGSIGIAIMFTPWEFSEGINFDTRSILLSLTGLFFGTIPSIITVIMTSVMRLYQGGAGALTGVAVIITSAAIGVLWRHFRYKEQQNIHWGELYLLGIAVHIAMLLWLFTLPGRIELDVLRIMSIPVMGIYPIGTVLLGQLLARQQTRYKQEEVIQQNEERLRQIVQHMPIMLDAFDENNHIIVWNGECERITGYKAEEIIGNTRAFEMLYPNPDEREEMMTELAKRPFHFRNLERPITCKDGSKKIISWSNISDQHPIPGWFTWAIGVDVTKRRQAEGLLKKSEAKYKAVVEQSLAGIYIFRGNQILFANDRFCEIFGYTEDEIYTQVNAFDLVAPDDKPTVVENIRQRIEKETDHIQYTARALRKNGEQIWLEIHGTRMDLEGEPVITGMLLDITERVQVAQAKSESEERFSKVFDASPTAISLYKLADYKIIEANQSFLNLTGFKYDEVIGNSSDDLNLTVNPEDQDRFRQLFQEHGRINNVEYSLRTKSGEIITTLLSSDIVHINNVPYGLSMLTNITEQKQFENELIESENRYRTLFENMIAGFVLFEVVQDDNGVPIDLIIIAANEGFESTTGLKIAEVSGKRLTHALPGIQNDAADWIGTFGKIALSGEGKEFEQGSELLGFYYHISAYQAGPNLCAVTFSDITERKQAEQNIKLNEERLRLATETAEVAVWEYDLVANRMARSDNHDQLYGLAQQDIWIIDTFLNATHPEDRELSNQIIQTSVAPGGPDTYEFDFRVIWPDESVHWLNVTAEIVKRDENGQGLAVRGCLIDITERKLAEKNIAGLNERISLAARAANLGIWDWDIANDELVWDSRMYALYGIEEQDFSGAYQAWVRGLHPDDRTRSELETHRALLGEAEYDTQFRVVWPDGTTRHLKANADVYRDLDGNPVRMVGVNYDITERVLAEQALRKSEERFSKIFHASPFPINLFRMADGRSVDANDAHISLTGYSREEFINKTATELNLIIDPNVRNIWMNEIMELGKASLQELQFRQKSGELRDVMGTIELIDVGGEKFGLAMAIDITERKQAEKERDEARQLFQKVFELNPVATTLTRLSERKIINVNEALEKLLGYTRAELIEKPTTTIDYWVDDEERRQAFEILREQGSIKDYEFSFKTKTGEMGRAITSAEAFVEDGEKYILTTLFDITARVQIEEERQKFVMLADSSSEFIGMCNLDLEPLYVNPAGVRMVGLPDMAAACQIKVQDYFFPEDQPFITEEFFPHVLQEGHGDVEIRLRHFQTGEPIWMNYYLFHLRDAGGAVIGWATVSRNITERKQAEIELKESEERFRTAFEHSASGMCLTGLDGALLQVNTPLCEMLGYTREELQGRHFNTLTHPEDMNIGTNVIRKMLAGEADTVKFEKRYLQKSGEPIWVNINSALLKDAAGEVQYFITQIEDITDRKKAESALKEAEQNERQQRILAQTLQQTAETLVGSIRLDDTLDAILNQLATVVSYDQALVMLVEAEELVVEASRGYKNGGDVLGEKRPYSHLPIVYEALTSGAPIVLFLQQIEENIEQLPWVESTYQTWIGVPLVARDITVGFLTIGNKTEAYHSTEIEAINAFANQAALAIENATILSKLEISLNSLKEAQDNLIRAARLSAIGELAAGIAHQVNNPLMTVVIDSHLLLKNTPADHPAYVSAEAIHQAAKRTAQVVERLLDFSRTKPTRFSQVDISISLDEAVTLLRAQLSDDTEINLQIDTNLPQISASADHLQDVWMNLLLNARDAVSENKEKQITIIAQENLVYNTVEVLIKDNGVGIPPDQLKNIFDPFFSTKTRGTGLGLAVCQDIINYHKGEIQVTSEAGKQTTFKVILPITTNQSTPQGG